jgi:hypothetical protein
MLSSATSASVLIKATLQTGGDMARIRSSLSYANVMATIALFLALGGGAYAALQLPKNSVGTRQLKKNAVVSSKVKNRSLLGRDFKAGQLPRGLPGPKGDQGSAGPRGERGPEGPRGEQGPAGTVPGLVSTNGTIKLSVGDSRTIWAYGPFTVTGTCTDNGGGNFSMALSLASTEANSALHGTEGTSNPDVVTIAGAVFAEFNNQNLDLAAPSGAALDLAVHFGVHGLGADCWVSGFGIGQG